MYFFVGKKSETLGAILSIAKSRRPYLAGKNTKNVEYVIADNFLNFWFRFIYWYCSAVEVGSLEWLQQKVLADYETYSRPTVWRSSMRTTCRASEPG